MNKTVTIPSRLEADLVMAINNGKEHLIAVRDMQKDKDWAEYVDRGIAPLEELYAIVLHQLAEQV